VMRTLARVKVFWLPRRLMAFHVHSTSWYLYVFSWYNHVCSTSCLQKLNLGIMIGCPCCLRRPLVSQFSIAARRSLRARRPWRYYVLPSLATHACACFLLLSLHLPKFLFHPCLLQDLWTEFTKNSDAHCVSVPPFFFSGPFF
jgi:hypothetical protein